jgi:hypothetical protein
MTPDEKALIEIQFKNLANLFETKLKASEENICSKVSGLEGNVTEAKAAIDGHISYHNSLNRRIVWVFAKGGVVLLVFILCVVLILGTKDGAIPLVLAKMLG